MIGDTSFMYLKVGTIFLVAVSQGNAQAAVCFQFLSALVTIIKSYCGPDMNDDTIRNNFVLIYELLDETLDYGYPQNTTVDLLKMYITQKGEQQNTEGEPVTPSNITIQATGAISWRKEGIKYRKNELFIDVVEQCNLMVSNKGTVLRNDVAGSIMVKCYLSGMPECKFGLNDKLLLDNEAKNKAGKARRAGAGIEIDDCSFHQCVKLGKFDQDRTVSFVPPDGEFQLMNYRISDSINLPFRVLPVVKELGRTRIEVNVKVKSMYTFKLFATNVVIKIPLPKNTAQVHINTVAGKAKYEAAEGAVMWRIRRFPGDTEYALSGEVEIINSVSEKAWGRPPITMDFQVPMFAASGLHVRFLKVFEKSNYQTIKWVRYITKAGTYQHRI